MFLRFSKSFVLSLTVSAMSITAIMAVPSAALAVEDAGSDADTSECGGTDGNYADAVLASYAYNIDVDKNELVSGPAFTALAKVLFGQAPAKGQLPVTIKQSKSH